MLATERLEHLAGDVDLLYKQLQYKADRENGADQYLHGVIGVAARAIWHIEQLRRAKSDKESA